jgi:hypothetical protein
VIEAGRGRKREIFLDRRSGFEFPKDPQFFSEPIILDRGQPEQMRRTAANVARANRRGNNFGDHERPFPDDDKLTDFGGSLHAGWDSRVVTISGMYTTQSVVELGFLAANGFSARRRWWAPSVQIAATSPGASC